MSEDKYLEKFLDVIKDGVDDLKDTITTQHNAFNVKLDMLIDKHAVTDKKVDRAHNRIDDIMEPLNEAIENSNDWAETKKKGKYLVAGGVAVGAAGGFSVSKIITGLWSWLTIQ